MKKFRFYFYILIYTIFCTAIAYILYLQHYDIVFVDIIFPIIITCTLIICFIHKNKLKPLVDSLKKVHKLVLLELLVSALAWGYAILYGKPPMNSGVFDQVHLNHVSSIVLFPHTLYHDPNSVPRLILEPDSLSYASNVDSSLTNKYDLHIFALDITGSRKNIKDKIPSYKNIRPSIDNEAYMLDRKMLLSEFSDKSFLFFLNILRNLYSSHYAVYLYAGEWENHQSSVASISDQDFYDSSNVKNIPSDLNDQRQIIYNNFRKEKIDPSQIKTNIDHFIGDISGEINRNSKFKKFKNPCLHIFSDFFDEVQDSTERRKIIYTKSIKSLFPSIKKISAIDFPSSSDKNECKKTKELFLQNCNDACQYNAEFYNISFAELTDISKLLHNWKKCVLNNYHGSPRNQNFDVYYPCDNSSKLKASFILDFSNFIDKYGDSVILSLDSCEHNNELVLLCNDSNCGITKIDKHEISENIIGNRHTKITVEYDKFDLSNELIYFNVSNKDISKFRYIKLSFIPYGNNGVLMLIILLFTLLVIVFSVEAILSGIFVRHSIQSENCGTLLIDVICLLSCVSIGIFNMWYAIKIGEKFASYSYSIIYILLFCIIFSVLYEYINKHFSNDAFSVLTKKPDELTKYNKEDKW